MKEPGRSFRRSGMLKFTRLIAILCQFAFVASLCGLLGAIVYCWRNHSGHSGVDPFLVSYFSAPVLALGISGLALTGGKSLPARAAAVTGLFGVMFGVFVTRLGILNQYGDWIAAGMPERNPHAALLLLGFAVVGISGSLAIAWMTAPQAVRGAE